MKVDWIKGSINPPVSGEYYVINRVLQDIDDEVDGTNYFRAGEFEVTGDWWDAEEKKWQSIGKNNPYWTVDAWADILKPDVPEDILDKVRVYFGFREDEVKNGTADD